MKKLKEIAVLCSILFLIPSRANTFDVAAQIDSVLKAFASENPVLLTPEGAPCELQIGSNLKPGAFGLLAKLYAQNEPSALFYFSGPRKPPVLQQLNFGPSDGGVTMSVTNIDFNGLRWTQKDIIILTIKDKSISIDLREFIHDYSKKVTCTGRP